jgi:RimJ/RimL family protein N-acetyltransferase
VPIEIRLASAADEPAITQIRRETWLAAYAQIIDPENIARVTGRALTDAALDGLRAAGYRRVVLWTLTDNARARRFYPKAGFAPDGATNILGGLGDVQELRYVRDL